MAKSSRLAGWMAQKWPLPLSLRPALTKHSLRDRLWRTLFLQLFSCRGDAASEPHVADTELRRRVGPEGTEPPIGTGMNGAHRLGPNGAHRLGSEGMEPTVGWDRSKRTPQLGLKGVQQLGPE